MGRSTCIIGLALVLTLTLITRSDSAIGDEVGSVNASAPFAAGQIAGIGTNGALTVPVICDQKVIYDASTNGSTSLVLGKSGKRTYVCGYTFFSAGTVNVKLISGTGSVCATDSTNETPAFQLTAQTGAVNNNVFGNSFAVRYNYDLCLNTSAGIAVQADVRYAQF